MRNDRSDHLRLVRDALHRDLVGHLEKDSGRLDHPLIRMSLTSLGDVEIANEQYASKSNMRDQAVDDGDWFTYLQIHERAHRLDAFLKIRSALSDQSYWELLGWIWIDTEFPHQNQSEWIELWNSNRAQKEFAMSSEDRSAFAGLPEKIDVYRGVGRGDNIDGLSWTLDREKARYFARRFARGHTSNLITGVAKKEDVHALLNGRNEKEIVVGVVSIISREVVVD